MAERIGKVKDLTGLRFGRLVALEIVRRHKTGRCIWRCVCDCGNYKEVISSYLTLGETKSCGCLFQERVGWRKGVKTGKRANNFKDLTGQVFGRLKVLGLLSCGTNLEAYWECLCDCGSICAIGKGSLLNSDAISCGCYRQEITSRRSITHGDSGSRLYKRYMSMISRCTLTTSKSYKNYGGRGIYVCDEWLGKAGWLAFKAWAYSTYPNLNELLNQKYELDRRNNDGPYAPWNCRYITRTENVRNRRITKYIQLNGERIVFAEAVEKYGRGLDLQLFYDRIWVLKWTPEEAFEIPTLTKKFMVENNFIFDSTIKAKIK